MLAPVTIMTRIVQNLLAADPDSMANTDKLKVALILAPFTQEPGLVVGDLTLGSADGLGPITAGDSTPENFYEPGTLDGIIQVSPPLGGWHWTYSGSTDVTVYGVALLDNTLATLYGTEEMPDGPVVLSTSGMGVDFGPVAFRIELGTI